jgi:hypothetical protein
MQSVNIPFRRNVVSARKIIPNPKSKPKPIDIRDELEQDPFNFNSLVEEGQDGACGQS